MSTGYVSISESLLAKRDGGKIKVQWEQHCRMCLRAVAELRDLPGRPDAIRVMTRHHLVPKLWFRNNPTWRDLRDCDANIVPLCRPDHDFIHDPDAVVRRQARVMLRRALSQAEISFAIQARGKDWFEKEYPLGAQIHFYGDAHYMPRSVLAEEASLASRK